MDYHILVVKFEFYFHNQYVEQDTDCFAVEVEVLNLIFSLNLVCVLELNT